MSFIICRWGFQENRQCHSNQWFARTAFWNPITHGCFWKAMYVNQFHLTTHRSKILHSHWDQTFITFIVCILWFPKQGHGTMKIKKLFRGNEQRVLLRSSTTYHRGNQSSFYSSQKKNQDFSPWGISLHVFVCRCLTEQYTTCCVRCWAGNWQPRSGLLHRPSQLTLQSWTLTTKSPPQPVSAFCTLFTYK